MKAMNSQEISDSRPHRLDVGLNMAFEIEMILSEVHCVRDERIPAVTPKRVLAQTQHEPWCRFELPFVRLDSAGTPTVSQKLPTTRSRFVQFKM
ncbi:hypothetical protein M2405_005706 [Rhodococcus erythropolis]|nr:hypothetical protein [Rhodococcus erythropolis]MCW2425662.1 hypothetical protein [Rhodococcus erythropolis]